MAGRSERVAVVTDSTTYLPDSVAAEAGLTVVPLTVVIAGVPGLEGVDITPADVAKALESRRTHVTTSRPAPDVFAETYSDLLDAGAPGVVSVHLSAQLSGTFDAACMAAEQFGDRVEVVDSRSTGMGLGFPALAAASAAADGKPLSEVRDAAIAAADRTTALFYVDTLEFLRRGGRIGAASALLGTALSVKPILRLGDGRIAVSDKVRTASRALARLVDLAVDAAGDAEVDVAVHHLVAAERAEGLRQSITSRLGDRVRRVYTTEVGAAVAAHTGPGLVCAVISRL
ncbi:DegV family protein [Planosporangium thailandense]|uniref:DegV family protein n=1 Tax=Planosporangium thailandense TaxID=765197 RepID=A0ABX0Y281_9ACTN|nr:DegV family protein [Planosporangium thailandense]NJC71680.1 DegV family protein [Planosporangium thailandense]